MKYEQCSRILPTRGVSEFWQSHRLIDTDGLVLATTGRTCWTREQGREFGPPVTRLLTPIYFTREVRGVESGA